MIVISNEWDRINLIDHELMFFIKELFDKKGIISVIVKNSHKLHFLSVF